MSDQTTPAERLLNLTIALVNTSGRMTKEQIRATVAGYADAPSDEAFERMFERDKDTLRELGIPVLTVTGAGHGDDIGYRVDQEAYALPPIDLTAAELGVLSLAARFWQDKALSTDASRALTKLRAVGAEPGAVDLVAGLAPRVRAAGGPLGPLLDAAQARQAVAFTYRAASTGEVLERHVEPWRLVVRGGWYLVGLDRDRGAPRSFRLSRIEGRVRPIGEPGAFTVPEGVDPSRALADRPEPETRVATLALQPERASALRSRALPVDALPDETPAVAADPRRDVVHVAYASTAELADEVVGYAEAVVVLDPPALRDAVLDRLRAAAALPALPVGGGHRG